MANLTAVAGALTASTKDVPNVKFLEIVNLYIRAHRTIDGFPVGENATNQQRLDWFVRQLGQHVRDTTTNQRILEATEAAGDAVKTDEAGTDWP